MNDELRSHLDAALAALRQPKDPIERERAARAFLEDLMPEAVRTAKQVRREAVEELRTGRTLREVGEALGGLSVSRVDQILKGK
ncbi:hypothetical protein [Kitasatospora sp. NPDC017646]|uniref:hypothetical protein n=1 Tax=Kitasatospora sp. NPDC017646 TaxID=3364024 RepID=UPI0037A7869C